MSIERRSLHELPPEIEEEESVDEPAAPGWFAVSRGAAFFFSAVTLLILLGELRFPHFNGSGWWLDLRPLPRPLARGLLALTAVLFLFFSFFPRAASGLRKLGAVCTVGLLGLTSWNAWQFYRHYAGHSGSEIPILFALHVSGCLIVILPGLLAAGWEQSNFFKDFLIGAATIATCLAGFPLAQFVVPRQDGRPRCGRRRGRLCRRGRGGKEPGGTGRRGPLGLCSLSRRKSAQSGSGRDGASRPRRRKTRSTASPRANTFRTGIFAHLGRRGDGSLGRRDGEGFGGAEAGPRRRDRPHFISFPASSSVASGRDSTYTPCPYPRSCACRSCVPFWSTRGRALWLCYLQPLLM